MNMFKGLLFLHGHFTRPEDLEDAPRAAYGARTAAEEFGKPLGNRVASAAWFGRDIGRPASESAVTAPITRNVQPTRKAQAPSSPRRQAGFLDHLLYLGGRPMHAGHNLDVEEPFEPLAGDSAIAKQDRRRAERRNTSCVPQTQTCSG